MCFRVVVSIDYISISRCLHRAFQNNSQTFDIIIVETKPQYIRVSNRTVLKKLYSFIPHANIVCKFRNPDPHLIMSACGVGSWYPVLYVVLPVHTNIVNTICFYQMIMFNTRQHISYSYTIYWVSLCCFNMHF